MSVERAQVLASSQASPYRVAIDLTLDTVSQRARNYKTLIIAIVSTGTASALWAVWNGTLAPLCGSLLLVPLCGVFSYHDSIVINKWKSQLFSSWTERQLDFSALNTALNSIPMLPQQTIKSMLASVPFTGDLLAERRISVATRKAMAGASEAISACLSDAIALNVAGYTLIALSVVIALNIGAWQPLLMGVPALAKRPLRTAARRLRLHHARQRLAKDQQNPDFDIQVYRAFMAGIDKKVKLEA